MWREVWEEMRSPSDRAAAILGDAVCESSLLRLMQLRLVDSEAQVRSLLSPPGRGMGLRRAATMAFCLGLITLGELEDFKAISAIRNVFAHHLSCRSFDDPLLEKHVARLEAWKSLSLGFDETSRENFNTTVSVLAYALTVREIGVEHLPEARIYDHADIQSRLGPLLEADSGSG